MKKLILLLTMSALFFSECSEITGGWVTGQYTDEFGDPVEMYYIQSTTHGTFSNSATTDSKLKIIITVDTSLVLIDLYEYGNLKVKGVGDIPFRFKDKEGYSFNINTWNDELGNNFILENESREIFINAIRKGEIKAVGGKGSTVYTFTINDLSDIDSAMERIGKSLK